MAKSKKPQIRAGSRVRVRRHRVAPPEPTIHVVSRIWKTKGGRWLVSLEGEQGMFSLERLVLVDDGKVDH